MQKRITFILGFHNHQPVGNFDHIFEEAYAKAYRPFLEILSDYPDIPFAIHNSGVLLDWLVEKHPEYLDLLARMVARGQVEVMSGGYYEPILTVIPERDRQGQLRMMRDFIATHFKAEPRGCWLTERIWDPHLPWTLSEAGLSYVVVDDSHFKSTGLQSDEMRGYFLSEENGSYVSVFPIDKKLRYLIPFRDPEETISYLHGIGSEDSPAGRVAVLADDGEKFGLWPGTHSLCYDRNWLVRFCDQLMANREWLAVSTFTRVQSEVAPLGIVYLPTASYSEMMEWALSLPAQELHNEAKQILRSSGRFEEPADLLRGGFWRNFLVKYEESNWMHKRMLYVSDRIERYGDPDGGDAVARARKHLYQAQCNCAYWHGLFGGLYLPHLRSAVFSHLITAERLITEQRYGREEFSEQEERDMDGDGVGEVILSTKHMQAFVKLRGASLRELDIREPAFNLTDTLTRRRELYHRDITAAATVTEDSNGAAVSIHKISAAKERDLDRYLVYDFHLRSSLLDHCIGEEVDLASFARSAYRERGDFINGAYALDRGVKNGAHRLSLVRVGTCTTVDGDARVAVSKLFDLSSTSPTLDVRYTVTPLSGDLNCRFAVESVVSLLAGNAPDRYFHIPGRGLGDSRLASMGEERDVTAVSMVDEWLGIRIRFGFEPRTLLWRFPIETVSNSESGFERVYQGSVIVPVWLIDAREGEKQELRITISVGSLGK